MNKEAKYRLGAIFAGIIGNSVGGLVFGLITEGAFNWMAFGLASVISILLLFFLFFSIDFDRRLAGWVKVAAPVGAFLVAMTLHITVFSLATTESIDVKSLVITGISSLAGFGIMLGMLKMLQR